MQIWGLDNPLSKKSNFETNLWNIAHAARLIYTQFLQKN